MKGIIFLLFCLSPTMNELKYQRILDGLELNYVLLKDEMGSSEFFSFYKINDREFKKRSAAYKRNVKKFYNSDKGILDYLLKFEMDTGRVVNWACTKNPHSSQITEENVRSASSSGLILIANYLGENKSDSIFCALKSVKSYDEIKRFLLENKRLNKTDLRIKFKEVFRK